MRTRCIAVVLGLLTPAAALAVDFNFTTSNPLKVAALGPPTPTHELVCDLTNNEAFAVDFHVQKVESLPTFNWTASICINGLCLSPFIYDDTVTVDPGGTDQVDIWVNALVNRGSAHFSLNVWPLGSPGEMKSLDLAALTGQCDVLLVDGDGGASYENDVIAALPSGLTYARWPLALKTPTAGNLNPFGSVVWWTGSALPAASDATILETYLNNVEFFLTGQNIAYSWCDPGSPNFSASACDFLSDHLGASYVADNSGETAVVGDDPDPIGGGASFTLDGSQTSPDEIEADGGNAAFGYDGLDRLACVHTNDGPTRAVFCSFGFEGIPSASEQSDLLERIFNYFDATVDVESGTVPVRRGVALGPNEPNPFNPVTHLPVHMDEAARAELIVFDPAGRAVRTLHEGDLPAGESVFAWDGKDGSGVSVRSGVYFVRLRVGDEVSQTRKVTLIR